MPTCILEFLQISGIGEEFVEPCPLAYTRPHAPTKAEILGTILCSVLRGHRRYAHITGIRGDNVLAKLLGIACLRSADRIRRAFAHQDEDALTLWSQWMARRVALIFRGWSLFTRIASGEKHGEAITTRPLLRQRLAAGFSG